MSVNLAPEAEVVQNRQFIATKLASTIIPSLVAEYDSEHIDTIR